MITSISLISSIPKSCPNFSNYPMTSLHNFLNAARFVQCIVSHFCPFPVPRPATRRRGEVPFSVPWEEAFPFSCHLPSVHQQGIYCVPGTVLSTRAHSCGNITHVPVSTTVLMRGRQALEKSRSPREGPGSALFPSLFLPALNSLPSSPAGPDCNHLCLPLVPSPR